MKTFYTAIALAASSASALRVTSDLDMLESIDDTYDDPISLEEITNTLDTLQASVDCLAQGNHECDGVCYPIIVRGENNVVLGPKSFSREEIELLDTLNSTTASVTTLSIFEDIDQMTRDCKLTWAVDANGDTETWLVDENNVKQGIYMDMYDQDELVDWPTEGSRPTSYVWTNVDGQKHGFELHYRFNYEDL